MLTLEPPHFSKSVPGVGRVWAGVKRKGCGPEGRGGAGSCLPWGRPGRPPSGDCQAVGPGLHHRVCCTRKTPLAPRCRVDQETWAVWGDRCPVAEPPGPAEAGTGPEEERVGLAGCVAGVNVGSILRRNPVL